MPLDFSISKFYAQAGRIFSKPDFVEMDKELLKKEKQPFLTEAGYCFPADFPI